MGDVAERLIENEMFGYSDREDTIHAPYVKTKGPLPITQVYIQNGIGFIEAIKKDHDLNYKNKTLVKWFFNDVKPAYKDRPTTSKYKILGKNAYMRRKFKFWVCNYFKNGEYNHEKIYKVSSKNKRSRKRNKGGGLF